MTRRQHRARIVPAVLAVVALACCGAAHSQQVYRCTVNGNVTFTDSPCNVRPEVGFTPSKPVTVSKEPASANLYGEWSGQAQYQATVQGQSVEAAHAVIDLVIIIDPDGKVTGESSANGCRALGIASPQSSQTLKLDVSLSECAYPGYNRRYVGTFGLPPGKDYATVSLLAYDTRPGATSAYDIKATMRR